MPLLPDLCRASVPHIGDCADNLAPVQRETETNLASEWAEWARDWTFALRGRGVADSTLKVYERSLSQFLAHLHGAGVERIEDITNRHVTGYLAALAAAGRSDSTRRVRLMALRAFFGWVVDEPHSPFAENPATRVEAPVAELPLIEVVTDEDLKALLATCRTGSFVDLRDAAIIRVLVSTGLRRAELVGLDTDDVEMSRGELYVMGKGGRPRVVTFGGTRTPLAMSRYARARRRHAGSGDAAFFLATRSSAAHGYRMTGGGIGLMLKRRSESAGIAAIKPHQLRHTWAHRSKVAGLADEDLERMAGWRSPMMVRRYGRAMADERARQAHRDLALGDDL